MGPGVQSLETPLPGATGGRFDLSDISQRYWTRWLRGKWVGGTFVVAFMGFLAALIGYGALATLITDGLTSHVLSGLGLFAFFAAASILMFISDIQVSRPAREVIVSEAGVEIRFPSSGTVLLRWSDPKFKLTLDGFYSAIAGSRVFVAAVGAFRPRIYASQEATRVIVAAAQRAGLDVKMPSQGAFDADSTIRIRASRPRPAPAPNYRSSTDTVDRRPTDR